MTRHQCPACGQSNVKPYRFDLTEGAKTVRLFQCASCLFIFAAGAASDAERHGDEFQSARDRATDPTVYTVGILHFLWYWSRRLHWKPSTSILDVGCAEGRLLELARSMGFVAEGIDVSGHHAARWREHGLSASVALAEDHAQTHRAAYDVVIARAVIEHVVDPLGFLSASAAMLKPGGHCLIETADAQSLHARVLGRRWGYWVPAEGLGAHVSFFGSRSARQLGERCGLRLGGAVPMFRYIPLDAYIQERSGRGRDFLTLAKYLFHRSRLSGGRCYWFTKLAT